MTAVGNSLSQPNTSAPIKSTLMLTGWHAKKLVFQKRQCFPSRENGMSWQKEKQSETHFGTGTKFVLGHWCICCVLISGRINKISRQVRFTVSFIISEPCAIKSVHLKPNAFKIWSHAWGTLKNTVRWRVITSPIEFHYKNLSQVTLLGQIWPIFLIAETSLLKPH